MENDSFLQGIDSEGVALRKVVRYNKGPLIKELVKSLVAHGETQVSAAETAREINAIFRFEHKSQGVYKELEFRSLITEVSRVICAWKKGE